MLTTAYASLKSHICLFYNMDVIRLARLPDVFFMQTREVRYMLARLPRIHREPHPHADDQRGLLGSVHRSGNQRGHRRRDEAGHEPPDGPSAARRLHRPGRLPLSTSGTPQRPGR